MYLVQTVSSCPRTWSSYSNLYVEDERKIEMNGVEDIVEYSDINYTYCAPALPPKTAATTYDFPEHAPKKDKKWSLSSLFRRKKKDDSESSSEEECDKKGFMNKKKKKEKRKKPNKQRSTFDHIVIPTSGRATTVIFSERVPYEDTGILSDPTGGFGSYIGRGLPNALTAGYKNETNRRNSRDVQRNDSYSNRYNIGSADSLLKKGRRSRAKVRAEARRENTRCDSSSDEDSQRSSSSIRFKSDESLGRSRDGSISRRSRAARTERYIRRLSKDEEGILNREGNLRSCKSDLENGYRRLIVSNEDKDKIPPSRSPSSVKSKLCCSNVIPVTEKTYHGLSTIPPGHATNNRNTAENVHINHLYKPPTRNSATSKYNSLKTTDRQDNVLNYQRSVSYDADIHKSASPEGQPEILHVQLPIVKPSQRQRNLSLIEQPRIFKHPPPPPPRDPWRLMTVQHHENNRPVSYCFERPTFTNNGNVPFISKEVPNQSRVSSIKPHSFNWHPNYRSTSEDHLPSETPPVILQPRPSSATTDNPAQRFIKRHPRSLGSADHYQYLTDKNPRSRKPIYIQPTNNTDNNNQSQSDCQHTGSQKALDFWKQKDHDELTRSQEKSAQKSSPQMFTAHAHVRTNIFLPSVLPADIENNTSTVDKISRTPSPFKPISPNIFSEKINTQTIETKQSLSNSLDDTKQESICNDKESEVTNLCQNNNRKSSNLEDALDELEAIYNSLRLGDEDLLERAEQREISIATKKLLDSKAESYPGWGLPRGAISDSSFSYEPFDSVDSPKRKRILRKSKAVDRKCDDMAYRKLNKERSVTLNDPKDAVSNVSYLLTSPLHVDSPNDVVSDVRKSQVNEPDVTFDDVVYRSVKHVNNTLKVSDPQPPFGIPVGPVLPAANSDYLHAVPETTHRYSFRCKKVPDVVKDDLAFRNLRKDSHKEPVLPQLSTDDFVNNNNAVLEMSKPQLNSLRKKRAVRSMSANIYNLIHDQSFTLPFSEEKSVKLEADDKIVDKSSLTDIADAMEIARQILKEKENKISATRKAFLSDTEAKYRKYTSGSESINERRLNFLNDMTFKAGDNETLQQKVQVNIPQDNFLQSKPPRGITPDKKSPSKDPAPIKDEYHRSSLEDLLTAFAVEAHETSERITNELKKLESDIDSPCNVGISNKNNLISMAECEDGTVTPDINEDKVTTEEYTCTAKSSNNFSDDGRKSAELLATHKTESNPIEQVEQILPAQELESLANIVMTRNADNNSLTTSEIAMEIHSESEHDYVNVGMDVEMEISGSRNDVQDEEPKAHDESCDERKNELVNLESQSILQAPCLESNISNILLNQNGDQQGIRDNGGEGCVLKCNALTYKEQECAFLTQCHMNISETGIVTSHVSTCDTQVSDCNPEINNSFSPKIVKDNYISKTSSMNFADNAKSIEPSFKTYLIFKENTVIKSRHDSVNDSPHSSGFHSNSSCNSVSDVDQTTILSSDEEFSTETFVALKSLESPRLVLQSSNELKEKNCLNKNTNRTNFNEHGSENTLSSNICCSSFQFIPEGNSIVSELQLKQNVPDFGKMEEMCTNTNSESIRKQCISKNVILDNETQSECNKSRLPVQSSSDFTSSMSSTSCDRGHTLDEAQPTCTWYNDPIVLAFACSYGFACTYQLVNMDVVTILGLVFVIISFVAALIL